MKFKKLVLPSIILVIAMIAMVVYGSVTNIAKKPTIPQHDFPFSITYELNGKTETVEGIYSVSYVGNGGYVDATIRQYEGTIISDREDADTSMILSDGPDGTIYLRTHFYPDYLMGDPAYDSYFSDTPFAPLLTYSNFETGDFEDEQTLLEHGARLISWEYPEPIENSFEYSHIAHLNGNVVLPLVFIAAAALLLILLLVKKVPSYQKRPIDKVSVILNFVITLLFVPLAAIVGSWSDIIGSSGDFGHQLMYLIPATTLLAVAASVSLRRKGFSKGSLIAQLLCPAVFGSVLVLFFL